MLGSQECGRNAAAQEWALFCGKQKVLWISHGQESTDLGPRTYWLCNFGQVDLFCFLESGEVGRGGVQLLTTQKPIKRPDWLKGKFALFWMPATRGNSRDDLCPKAYSSPRQLRVRAFMEGGRGLHAETTVIEIGHQWSGQPHLDHFSYA